MSKMFRLIRRTVADTVLSKHSLQHSCSYEEAGTNVTHRYTKETTNVKRFTPKRLRCAQAFLLMTDARPAISKRPRAKISGPIYMVKQKSVGAGQP